MKPTMALFLFLCMSAAAQVQFQRVERSNLPPQAQTGKASVEGSVLDAVSREPVKKASVILNGQVGLYAVTDASGHFAFRQLPAGQYTIQTRSDKYPPGQGPFDTGQQLTISLAAEEQKMDIRLTLSPGASVHGRIVDEEGTPMPNCTVNAARFHDMGTGRTLQQAGFAQTDNKGEYRVSNLPHGKYYIQARCGQTLPLPHAFIRRSSTMDVPALTYAPQFYGGAADPAGAARVEALPGAEVSGIDFQMAPARGFTVRGRVGSVPGRNVQLTLAPQDSASPESRTHRVGVSQSTGEFRIPNVLPGSYDLTATAWAEGISYYGKVPVEVGVTPPEPIVLALAAAPAIAGSISMEGDTANPPANNARVMMNPTDGRGMMGPQPQAEVQSDGTFLFSSVMPGRWRIFLNGVPGYVKSVKLGDREVPSWDIEIDSSAAQLKVVVSTKYTRVDVLSATGAGSEPISAILWPASGDPGFQQNIGMISQNPISANVPPGRYYACGFAVAPPWNLMQSSALRTALEKWCETLDAPEGGSARVRITPILAADLKELIEKIDQ